MNQKDIETLAIALPEDILKAKWCGDFDRAFHLIDLYLANEKVPAFMKTRLALEREVLKALPTGYTYSEEDVYKRQVYACGSVFAEETAAALLELLPKAELCPVTGWLELPEEIELTVRTNEKNGRSYAFLLNYTAQPQTVTVQKPTKELLTRETLDGTYTMERCV